MGDGRAPFRRNLGPSNRSRWVGLRRLHPQCKISSRSTTPIMSVDRLLQSSHGCDRRLSLIVQMRAHVRPVPAATGRKRRWLGDSPRHHGAPYSGVRVFPGTRIGCSHP